MATELTNQTLINQKSLRDLAAMLVRDANIHEGLFDISLEIQIAIGMMGPTTSDSLPGALVGVKSVGLLPAAKVNQHTVDAAEVNPRPVTAKKRAIGKLPSR